MTKNILDFRWRGLSYSLSSSCVPGVIEYFGEDARLLRQTVRKMEDVLDSHGFDQLFFGTLVNHDIFAKNLNFLGTRFMENLVYSKMNGEDNVVVLPEGTIKTYDFIRTNRLEQARIFYSSMFTRNEPVEDVRNGKTRNFWQIGLEVFNHPLFESSVEVIQIANEMMQAVGLKDVVIRLTDKRLIKGYIARYTEEEQAIVKTVMDKANDDPTRFQQLYRQAGGADDTVEKEVSAFIALIANSNLTISDLEGYANGNDLFLKGLRSLEEISGSLKGVRFQLLPFMAKSWDACWALMFDGRYPGYDAAICGGGNLSYNRYRPECPKSGVGVGVTRILDILKEISFSK